MITKQDRLNQLTELRNPELRMARILADRTIAKAILKLGTLIGSDGKDGVTPIKGKDYFTQQEIDQILQYIKSQTVINGRDGERGLQGLPGRDGRSGTDGLNGKDGKPGKDGVTLNIEDIVAQVKRLPVQYKDIQGTPDFKDLPALIQFLKAGGFRGGGGSSSGSVTSFIDSEVVSGSATTFTLANTPVVGSVHVYALGQRLTPTNDYTISGAVITTVSSWSAGDLLADYRR